MSIFIAPKINTDGLILYVDAVNSKSFRGEPTTNLVSCPDMIEARNWVNNGAYTINTNETDVSKPVIPGFDTQPYKILSNIVTTAGSIHVGCAYKTGLTPSTTYTISVWFRQNRAGASQPYLRTDVNNNSLGNFSYNGNTTASTWPVNTWIRITATGTTQSNETGLFLSNYIDSVGDKVWYFGQQLEQLNHVTNLVNGTRGSTVETGGGFKDLTLNHHGSIVNCPLYSSINNGCLEFDGVNDYITFGTGANFFPLPSFTIDVWFKSTGLGSGMSAGGILSITYGIGFRVYSGNILNFYVDNGTSFTSMSSINFNPFDGNWHNFVAYNTGSFSYIYIDGLYNNHISSIWSGTTRWPTNTVYMGTDANNPPVCYFKGHIGELKVYNRVLSDVEIQQNYNALKGRYGL